MSTVFISYRRSDSQDVTGRIYDRLVAKFTKKLVFRDIDNIPLGITFPIYLKQTLGKSAVALVIIGRDWVNATDEQGRRRLDDPNDFIRMEVEAALRANVPVIPVLVSNARIPLASELPQPIKAVVSRSGTAVRPDPDFANDRDRLIAGIERVQGLPLKPKPDKNRNEPRPSAATTETMSRATARGDKNKGIGVLMAVFGMLALSVLLLILALLRRGYVPEDSK